MMEEQRDVHPHDGFLKIHEPINPCTRTTQPRKSSVLSSLYVYAAPRLENSPTTQFILPHRARRTMHGGAPAPPRRPLLPVALPAQALQRASYRRHPAIGQCRRPRRHSARASDAGCCGARHHPPGHLQRRLATLRKEIAEFEKQKLRSK
jgi:hypothetical protein